MNTTQIPAGKEAMDTYRLRHKQLYRDDWYQGISDDHTPLLNTLLTRLTVLGFNSIDEFFATNELFNITDLGFTSKADFEAKATLSDRQVLMEMWH